MAFVLLESTVFRGQVGCDVFAKAKVVAEWPWTWPSVHTNTLTVMANMAVAWAVGDILKCHNLSQFTYINNMINAYKYIMYII